ncbi:MAG: hypothetical protein K6F47_10905 [Bacteroidaceae bacterium]|nr:hypothetical protein [Bacteroidaceae bacterium]
MLYKDKPLSTISGTINAMIHDDPSLVLKGAAGGALSGCVRTVAHNAVFGAGYQPLDENGAPVSYGADGVYRKGGLAQYFPGGGLALGRYAYMQDNKTREIGVGYMHAVRYHENMHFQQQKEKGGFIRFYRKTGYQYLRYGFPGVYHEKTSLEYSADEYGYKKTGVNLHLYHKKPKHK